MKIALSTTVIQRGKTGVAQYVFALVRALMEQPHGHDITLLVLEEDFPLFDFAKNRLQLVPVPERCRQAVKNILWHQLELPRWLEREGIDLVHVPSYRRMLAAAPCARVATIHDLAPFHVKGKYDVARMFYGRVVVRWLARRQDGIVAVSTHTARDIERFFGIPMARQTVILNGLDHERFHPGNAPETHSQAARQWGLAKPFFLYISRLEHPAKNHVRLIQAFAKFKADTGSDWQLALGGSDWHGAEAIHAAAAASPAAGDIRFLGFVDDASLPQLYRAAGAFVYPSLFEGFGFPPVEAMACGCPVISSKRGALDEVVGDAVRAVNPEDVEDLAAALFEVATDTGKRNALVNAGFANARRLNWSNNARNLVALYEGIVIKNRNTRCINFNPTLS